MGERKKVAKRRKRTYVGYLEFSFTPSEIEDIMKQIVKSQIDSQERRFDDYIRTIRGLQRQVKKLEIQVTKLEMRKK